MRLAFSGASRVCVLTRLALRLLSARLRLCASYSSQQIAAPAQR
jgi:hypothetical protein